MSYKNKTYVAFASEDITSYRLMEAWRENKNIEFNFYDAHDLYISRDSSSRETIKKNLRERLKNAKQVVLIGSSDSKKKSDDGYSFLAYEIEVINEFNIPVVIANKDGNRGVVRGYIPKLLLDNNYYTLSISFQPAIIKFALDSYTSAFYTSGYKGSHYYEPQVYSNLGI